jgi:hypothetical protein
MPSPQVCARPRALSLASSASYARFSRSVFNAPPQAMTLVEHCMDRLPVMGSRLEDAEVLEVGKHGEQDLVAYRRDLHLGQHQA